MKESYLPTPVSEAEWKAGVHRGPEGVLGGGTFDPYAREGDKLYVASKIVGLNVMLNRAPGSPGTDGGWIYGTLTPEGEVTAAGRVASCMGFHTTSKNDRVLR